MEQTAFSASSVYSGRGAQVRQLQRRDLYFLLLEEQRALGYGMLRGWDEGYAIPSLGVVIHPEAQGHGLGRLMMEFLRIAAIRRGAEKIRLRVALANKPALS